MQSTATSVSVRELTPLASTVFSEGSRQAITNLMDLAMSETNAQGAYLYHFGASSGSGRLVLWTGLPPAPLKPGAERDDGGIGNHRGRHAPVVLHEGAFEDPRFQELPGMRGSRFEGVISLPLLEAGNVIGMLNVCRLRRLGVQPRELAFLLGLAVPVGALLAAVTAKEGLEQQVGQLTEQLASRKLMERAKGLIQARFRCTEEQAYYCLRNLSRRRRTPMRHIALEVIRTAAAELPAPTA